MLHLSPAVRRLRAQTDAARLALALLLGSLGLLLAAAAALADGYFHRGVETGIAAPYVHHPAGRGLATNVDLTVFPPTELADVAAALQHAGFRYVRQSFAWSEIEPTPGRYVWDRYDAIVAALAARNIEPVAVLHRSPDWARAAEDRGLPDAPPVDPAAYAEFVDQLTRRYAGRVRFVQLWDLPNRADRWGGEAAAASDYAELLAVGANAAWMADPDAQVVLAELDPAPANGPSDLDFLDDLLDVGAGAFFDVAAVRIDGGVDPPLDRRVAEDHFNLSRAVLFRELLLDHGEAAKPIWATRYGWPVGEGGVDAEEQAVFYLAGLRRAEREWPWMGPMFAWDLLPAGEDAGRGYALLGVDGAPTPLFTAIGEFGRETSAAGTGFAPVGSEGFSFRGSWADQDLGQLYKTTNEEGASVTVRFRGTDLIAFLRLSPAAGPVSATLDGEPLTGWSADRLKSFAARDVPITLATGLDDTTHELTLTLEGPGELTVGGAVVGREVPFIWPMIVLGVAAAAFLFVALREAVYVAAMRAGYLQRRRGVDLWPPLPQLPDWQPSRHA